MRPDFDHMVCKDVFSGSVHPQVCLTGRVFLETHRREAVGKSHRRHHVIHPVLGVEGLAVDLSSCDG